MKRVRRTGVVAISLVLTTIAAACSGADAPPEATSAATDAPATTAGGASVWLIAGVVVLIGMLPWTPWLLGGLLQAWREQFRQVTDHFQKADPKQRVKWAGPDMSARSSITARLMETWAHGQAVYDLLGRHGAAYVVMSGPRLPCVLRATTDFVYVRMHGPDTATMYAGSYTADDLRWWAERIREWRAQDRRVLVYFNNDGHGHAVRNALDLRAELSG